MVKYFVLLLMVFYGASAWSQDSVNVQQTDTLPKKPVVRRHRVVADTVKTDSLPQTDSAQLIQDTLEIVKVDRISGIRNLPPPITTFRFSEHRFFRFTNPTRFRSTRKQWTGKEALFYSMIGLLLFFALIRNAYYRYVDDLLKSYFRTSVKQKQLKEQLLQSPMPSLLLNVFFVLSIGLFLTLLLQYLHLGLDVNFWNLYVYCIAGLLAIYAIKYLTLKLIGWIFQVSDATDTYIFIVFSTNKVIGMFLIPFLVVLAFTQGLVNQTAMTLSIVLVCGMLIYRVFLSYVSLKDKVKWGLLHFLVYLIAFEIAPLLLINKLLFRFLGETS